MNDFAVVVLSGMFGSSVSVTLDALEVAAGLAARLGLPAPRWEVWAPGGKAVLGNGLTLSAHKLTGRATPQARTIIVPGLGLPQPSQIEARLAQPDALLCAEILRRHVDGGGRVAASCASAFLLESAGLLQGRRVTTSWWLGHALQQRAPDCRVDTARMVVADGPLVTAGGALSQLDLMLWLLRDGFGARLAELVAQYLVIDGRDSQSRYMAPMTLQSHDPLVQRFEDLVTAALPRVASVREMAGALNMSERTLARRLTAATGRPPLALIQLARINRARMLLESSRHSVEEIAEQVGYADATALRRLIRRLYGATPSQLRRFDRPVAETA